MSITLLTAVPGGGKTSYAVWNVIKTAFDVNGGVKGYQIAREECTS